MMLMVACFCSILLSHNSISSSNQKDNDLNIVYLNEEVDDSVSNSKMKKAKLNPLMLDNDNDAYVLNKTNFQRLEKNNTDDYLSKGGIVAVTDKTVNSDLLKDKIETDVIDFDFSETESGYQGFYVYEDNDEFITVNVAAGSMGTMSDENDDGTYQIDYINPDNIIPIDKNIVASDMVKSARLHFDRGINLGGWGTIDTDTSGEIIAFGFLENYLYLQPENTKLLCSYTIMTEVMDVAKIRQTSNGVTRGIYDVRSTFTVDAEEGYAVTDYKTRMKTSSTIIDASYLNSNTSTTVSLGGSLGFQGDTITGSVNAGISYTYTPDSQTISNDLGAGNTKYWSSNVVSPTFGASYKLIPAIRILNNNDIFTTYEYSRVEEFKIKDSGWWIFNKKYYMIPECRHELKLSYNSDGTFEQDSVIG